MNFIDLGPYEYLYELLSHLAGFAACSRATSAAAGWAVPNLSGLNTCYYFVR